MRRKKKTLASVSALAREQGMAQIKQPDPCTQYTTMSGNRQSQIIDILGRGRDSAVTANQIAERLGVSARDVSRVVNKLRASGVPICASSSIDASGYYLADGPGELEKYLVSFDHRLLQMRRTREALTDTLVKMSGQETLGGM